MVESTKPGRRTRLLREWAWERFKGCEKCWPDDACVTLEVLLKPLRLHVAERNRLAKVLDCPRCGSSLDFYYDDVVPFEADELRIVQKQKNYRKKYERQFRLFHEFLIKHPSLGGFHPIGEELNKAVARSKTKVLQPGIWYRARRDKGSILKASDFLPADPRKYELGAGRFNYAGQLGYYVAEEKPTAAIEILGKRTSGDSIWIAGVKLLRNLRVLDLQLIQFGSRTNLPLLLNGLVYSGIISAANEADKSRPEYRVTQFIADLVRFHRLDGIIYTRTRDSGFPNPEAFGTNLVVLRAFDCSFSVEDPPRLYRFEEDCSHFVLFPIMALKEVSASGESINLNP